MTFIAFALCVSLLADVPPELQSKVDHAVKRRAELVARYETLLAQPEQTFNRELQRDAKARLADLRAGGVRDLKIDMQIAKPGYFGIVANRRLAVVRIIDDSTAIEVPVVNKTATLVLGGGGGQIVKAAPVSQFILSGHPTAGLSLDGNLSLTTAVAVVESQVIGGQLLPVVKPFDLQQLKPHLRPLK